MQSGHLDKKLDSAALDFGTAVESKDIPYFLERYSTVDEIKEAIQVIIQSSLENKSLDVKPFIKMLNNYFITLLNERNSKEEIQKSILELEKIILSNKQTLPFVVSFLNLIRYNLYFFGSCGCLYSNTPSFTNARRYYNSLQELVQKKTLQEPAAYSLADLLFLIDQAENYDSFLKRNKRVFSKDLDGKIFKDIGIYLDQCRLIYISTRAMPDSYINNETFLPILKKLEMIFENIQSLISVAKVNPENFVGKQLSVLNNIRLNLTITCCRIVILKNKINKVEVLEYIDIIKKIRSLANHTSYIFDSHLTEGDLYQALNEEGSDPSYANLSKQCFVEAYRYNNAPEISYLINLWISLLDFKRAKIKLYDDALLTSLFSTPFPEKERSFFIDKSSFYFLHGRMGYVLESALAIAAEAKEKNRLFAYHFLDRIVNLLMKFFVSFFPDQVSGRLHKVEEGHVLAILQCKATLAAELTLSSDFSKEIDFLQKYAAPKMVNIFNDYVKKLFGLSLSGEKNQASSSLESKQTETKEITLDTSKDSAPAQSNKEPAKDTAETKKNEAELKISQARKLLNKELINIDYRSAIFSLGEAQKALSSRLCRDTEARILKIEAALLLSDCYIETEDFKLAENEARGARDTANAIMDPAVTGPALNYLNDLLFSLPNYCRKLIINQGSDLEPYSFPEENFSQPDERIIRLISLAKNTITKVIQKGVTPKQPVSLSSVMPILESQSIQDISLNKDKEEHNNADSKQVLPKQDKQKPNTLSTSSSSSAAVKPAEKSNSKKQDAKSFDQQRVSYAAKTKSKALKQKHQSNSSSSSAVVNHSLQSSSIVSRQVDSAPKSKAEDKKQEVSSSSSSQENKSSSQSGNHLVAFSITTEQSKALSESAKVNEAKTESKGYGTKLAENLESSKDYNEAIIKYLKSNTAQTTIEQHLEKLKLTEVEREIFEKELSEFDDIISGCPIRIPVLLNGMNFYDLEEIIQVRPEVEDTGRLEKPVLLSRVGRLPLRSMNGSLFTLESLQPGWLMYKAVEEFAKKVEAYRIANKSAAINYSR